MPLKRNSPWILVIVGIFSVVPLQAESDPHTTVGYPALVAIPVLPLDTLSDTTGVQAAEPPKLLPKPGLGATVRPFDSLPADPPTLQGQVEGRSPAATRAEAGLAREKGLVLAAETGKPVSGVMILLIGEESVSGVLGEKDRYTAQSDKDGIYHLIGVKAGRYRIKAGRQGFSFYEAQGAVFTPGENPIREIRLERSVLKGQLIEAKGGSNAGGAASMMAARKSSSSVMEGVGAEQIAKGTDSDAGAVAKRVTGASVIGGKFVYVRGLGERYTNMTLNGLPVPSPEKDKRVVPQDLFPSSIIEMFSIYKTLAPDLSPDFAGGHIALVTKGIPDKDEFKLELGVSAKEYIHDGAWLTQDRDRLTYDGGSGWQTYLGFDDGTRAVPDGVPDNINQVDYGDSARAGF
ncbi:MAG: TonB-dependent receptor plug domain-containing protein, partial [Fibrobacteria bacterium]